MKTKILFYFLIPLCLTTFAEFARVNDSGEVDVSTVRQDLPERNGLCHMPMSYVVAHTPWREVVTVSTNVITNTVQRASFSNEVRAVDLALHAGLLIDPEATVPEILTEVSKEYESLLLYVATERAKPENQTDKRQEDISKGVREFYGLNFFVLKNRLDFRGDDFFKRSLSTVSTNVIWEVVE